MVIDRKIQPQTKAFSVFKMPKLIETTFDNNINFLYLPVAKNDLIRIDFIFDAGISKQNKPLQALFTSNLLSEGTSSYSSNKISECLDYYGAFLDKKIAKDCSIITFYVAKHNLRNIIDLIDEIISCPIFPTEEIELYRKKLIQNYKIQKEKINFLAKQKFLSFVQQNSPYYNDLISEEFINDIQKKDINSFYNNNYSLNKLKILVTASKNYYSEIESIFYNRFSKNNRGLVSANIKTLNKKTLIGEKFYIHKKGTQQAAIRVGGECINKNHPDYCGLSVLNTTLGGYFGSRLMSNLREDKGYTYGISSIISSAKHQSVFQIATQVNSKIQEKAILEIYNEINHLKNNKIKENELNTVKNYIFGSLIRSIDSVYSISEKIIYLLSLDLKIDYYTYFLNNVKKISSNDLLEIAEKHFDTDLFCETIVSK